MLSNFLYNEPQSKLGKSRKVVAHRDINFFSWVGFFISYGAEEHFINGNCGKVSKEKASNCDLGSRGAFL